MPVSSIPAPSRRSSSGTSRLATSDPRHCFPRINQVQPAIRFSDGLYEAFNAPGGSLMGAYTGLFQLRVNFAYTRGNHAWRWGFEMRQNRDSAVFGQDINGGYTFGGGTVYSPVNITSASGRHNIGIGDPLARFPLRLSHRHAVPVQHLGHQPAVSPRGPHRSDRHSPQRIQLLHAGLLEDRLPARVELWPALRTQHALHGAQPPDQRDRSSPFRYRLEASGERPAELRIRIYGGWGPRLALRTCACPPTPSSARGLGHHHPAEYLAGELHHGRNALCGASAADGSAGISHRLLELARLLECTSAVHT